MLSNVDDVNWNLLRHAYGEASDVPAMLYAIDEAKDDDIFLEHYRKLMESVNHQGDIYDSTAYIVPSIIQMLKQSTDLFRTINHLTVLAELLRHTNSQHFRKSAFSQSIVHYRPSLNVYEEIKGSLDYYLELLSHKNEDIRAGGVYVLSFLVDEYARILPILYQKFEDSQNVWLRAGIIWAYATMASYELTIAWDADTLAQTLSKHLQILEAWSHVTEQIISFSAAIGYISVLASNRSHHSENTPEHIINLVVQALSTNISKQSEANDRSTRHIRYVQNEITPFNDVEKFVIRWCQQANTPRRWEKIMSRPDLSPIKAHKFVRTMLDANFSRINEHQSTHIWHNHTILNISTMKDGIIYNFADTHAHNTLLSDNQRLVLRIICDCDAFWEIPTNLLSFYYGLPDDYKALRTLSKQ